MSGETDVGSQARPASPHPPVFGFQKRHGQAYLGGVRMGSGMGSGMGTVIGLVMVRDDEIAAWGQEVVLRFFA